MPYRDSTAAIRECIAELEGERAAIDRELAALREQLAALAPYADRRDPGCLVVGRVMGFVLAALLAVIVATSTWLVHDFSTEAKTARASEDLDVIRAGALAYGADAADCPTVGRLKARELVDELVRYVDPWDTPYAIVCVGSLRIARSMGPDGLEGGGDDLTSAGWVRTAAPQSSAASTKPGDSEAPYCPVCGNHHGPLYPRDSR